MKNHIDKNNHSDIVYISFYEQPVWQQVQDFSKGTWNSYSKFNVEKNKLSFEDLISASKPINTGKFLLTAKEYNEFDFVLETDFGKSEFWISEAINTPNNILRFIEAVVDSEENNIYFYFDEEGPDTFLYVNNIGENIRFIHLSPRKQFARHIECEDYKILQDIIINKKEFVKTFYSTLKNIVKNIKLEQYLSACMQEEINDLKKDSYIIKKYLEENK